MIREPKQEIAQETPIEVVEVPANKTDIPPKTSFRATKNSIAGGKALPKRPVSAMKSANPTEYKGYNNRSSDLTASSPAEVFQTRRQQKRELPNISRQQPQFKSQKTISASVSEAQLPNSKKIAVAPMARPLPVPLLKTAPNPKPIPSAHTTTVQTPDFKKIAVAPLFKTVPLTKPLAPSPKPIASARTTTVQTSDYKKLAVAPLFKTVPLTKPLAPNPKQTALERTTTVQVPNSKKLAVAPLFKTVPLTKPLAPNPKQTALERTTTVQVPNSKKITVAPTTTPLPVTQGKTAIERATTLPVPSNPKKLGQSTTRLSARTPTQAQSSLKTGAASLLGGTVGISSQNYRGDDLAALPNSNRDRQATSGIDARSQDVDLTAYLNQLKQRVRQQWLPGMSQSNRRTVLNFTINRSGQVSNLNIAQTSGFSVTDEIALNAIQRSAPFAPLPTEYPKNHLDIEFTFDINVYGELNLWRDGG
ncbi:TonB family protein [Nostoc sp. ChiVER01]|uniref:TonB family protein n=1 Tax=Nostoc sp. ChiVER01 TaxID=3075382 RepID=UPI002AD4F7F9|nr:TonB family protein [Nostoc sp. ChiVER01]